MHGTSTVTEVAIRFVQNTRCIQLYREVITVKPHVFTFLMVVIFLQNVHREERVGVQVLFPCRRCGRSFQTIFAMHQHEVAVHDPDVPFICPVCGKGLQKEREMRGHMANKHGMPKEFQCHICHKAFGYKYVLQKHIRALHSSISHI